MIAGSCKQGQAVAVDEHAACGSVRRARLCVQQLLLPMLSTAAQRSSAMKGEAPAELAARLMQGHEERGSRGGEGDSCLLAASHNASHRS